MRALLRLTIASALVALLTPSASSQIMGARWHYATPRPVYTQRRASGAHNPEGVPGYPRYVGGFHARYFDNYGIPSGDLGPRGNGIFVTPW